MPTRAEETPKSSTPAKTSTASKKAEPKKDIVVDEGKASVTYSISITKSLGNFESLKIQAGITVPYGADDTMLKDLDKLLVLAREKVTERLQTDLESITEVVTTT